MPDGLGQRISHDAVNSIARSQFYLPFASKCQRLTPSLKPEVASKE